MTESELLELIAAADIELHNATLAVCTAKRKVTDAETMYLESKLAKERLVEQLRVKRLRSIDVELSHREKDIARFKEALPNLLKNDKWNK